MTIYTVALISPLVQGATLAGAVYNLVVVTIGNMIGGALFMGVELIYLEVKKLKVILNPKLYNIKTDVNWRQFLYYIND